METVMMLLAMAGVAVAVFFLRGNLAESRVRQAADQRGYILTSIDTSPTQRPPFPIEKGQVSVRFSGRVAETGQPIGGWAVCNRRNDPMGRRPVEWMFDPGMEPLSAAAAQLRDELESEEPQTLSHEQRVRREINRRLDEIQGDRQRFLAHDADGDGMVDAEEWNAVRQRVETEVRAELGAAIDDRPVSPPDEAESPAQPANANPDGHW